ncbi:PglL family O-oligosaccharyltransferase [Acinetobacter tianfuensis]|uniref:Polymerase n=1 Tax=Acinetobacter tianfuensis TaxID=2419603 RepID=A0A3A8ECK1_9GAMM|nr:O-antigen ligase family protein [Acinetobacter tianfuensis]RKG31939.1 polymerase [Acinetobacter tianfuensis]
MKNILFIGAAICLFLSWLMPVHYRPWVTYTGELYAFIALVLLMAASLKEKLLVPKIALPFFALSVLPLLHFTFGHVYYFSIALLGFLYVGGFCLALVLGFSLSQGEQRRTAVFSALSYTFLISGVATGLIAICQALNFDEPLNAIMMNISGSTRPFANFAQPNLMATFLLMALMATLYLYEKKALATKWLVLCALPILIGVVLSQSRTSWVASISILLYLAYQQFRHQVRLRWFYSLAWFSLFAGMIMLMPHFTQMLAESSSMEVLKSRDLAQRAGGDMSRLAIWQQMLHAVAAQPWFGYGWYQSSTAFVSVSEFHQGPVWIRSAHNFMLDFLLWNGAAVAVPFFAYLNYWLIQLHRQVNSAESVIGMLMLGAFAVHALLEFPQNYAFFLLPVGFILGTLQAQNIKTKVLALPALSNTLILAFAVFMLALVYRDYDTVVPKLGNVYKYENTPEKITNFDRIYVLTELDQRINFIMMNPTHPATPEQIELAGQMARSYPTRYHIIKYAKMLANNGYEAEARHQLKLLKIIQKMDLEYDSLLQKPAS